MFKKKLLQALEEIKKSLTVIMKLKIRKSKFDLGKFLDFAINLKLH